MRQKIYFISGYIASLKYYEKLLPYLEEHDVFFLLFEDKGLIDYCKKHNIPFTRLFLKDTAGMNSFRFPFVCHFRDWHRFSKKCDKFLEKQKPTKLISAEQKRLSLPVKILFKKANVLGLETMILQWCQQQNKRRSISREQKNLKLRQRYGSFLKGAMTEAYYQLLLMLFDIFYPKLKRMSINDVKKVGVFGDFYKEVFIERGVDPGKISIVGNIEAQLVRELRQKTGSKEKKTILVISTIFYAGHAAVCMKTEEQVAYYRKIFEEIRKFFPREEANIIFKTHPREKNIYQSYEELGVKIIGTDAQIEELIAVSDLYVTHPGSSANFTACASKVSIIFLNFTPLDFLDEFGKKFYGVKKIAKNIGEFSSLLEQFKNGNLSQQYASPEVDMRAIEKAATFITS